MGQVKDETGNRYGNLTVLRRGKDHIFTKTGYARAQWWCRCDCGKEILVQGANLRNGHTKSCRDCGYKRVSKARQTHGLCGTKIHNEFRAIIQRCENPNSAAWPLYGGRGVRLYPEWRENPRKFFEYVSQLPHFGEPGYSIDRWPNKDGNYEPGNIRWATMKEQTRNLRSNFIVHWKSQDMPLSEACELEGLPYKTVHSRVKYLGWSVIDALTRPIGKNGPKHK